jgi:signal transduction histidine kinase
VLNWIKASWRVALLLLIVIPTIIFGGAVAVRWISIKAEDHNVPPYLVAPAELVETVVVRRILERLPQSAWNGELTSLNSHFAGKVVTGLASLEQMPELEVMPLATQQALRAGHAVITRASITRPNEIFKQYVLMPNTTLVLSMAIKPSAFYTPTELSFMGQVNEIAFLGRALVVFAIIIVCVIPFLFQTVTLLRGAKQYEEGNFNFRIKMFSLTPMYPIACALNELAKQVAALIESQKALVNAAAHELRTPLTRLRYAQEMANSAINTDDRQHFLCRIETEARALDELISELLFYARLDRKGSQIAIDENLDTKKWFAEEIGAARFFSAAINRDVTISYQADAKAMTGNIDSLKKLMQNLLTNSIRHAASQVHVHYERNLGMHRLTVDDDGPGIAPQERERVFEPFVHIDVSGSAGTTTGAGTGLGLAIVARIAKLHRGAARATSSPLGGARIVVEWPVCTTRELSKI